MTLGSASVESISTGLACQDKTDEVKPRLNHANP